MPELYLRQASVQLIPKQGKPTLLKDFRVSFQIEKTSESTPNPAKIAIYNLSKGNQSLFESPGQTIILQVGYTGLATPLVKTLFIGDIITAKTSKKGSDFVTEIEAGDAEKKIVQSYINKGFSGSRFKSGGSAKNTTRDMVRELIREMGLIPNKTKEAEINKKLEIVSETEPVHGVTLSGPAKLFLDAIMDKEGLQWSIQDGEIQIIDPQSTPNTNEAILLTKLTGLLDVSKEDEQRINFKALLNPQISPTKFIKIQSSIMDIDGVFRVTRVNYSGDTHEGKWMVDGEALTL